MRSRCDSVLACAAGVLVVEQIAARRGVHLQATPYPRNAATPLCPEVTMAVREAIAACGHTLLSRPSGPAATPGSWPGAARRAQSFCAARTALATIRPRPSRLRTPLPTSECGRRRRAGSIAGGREKGASRRRGSGICQLGGGELCGGDSPSCAPRCRGRRTGSRRPCPHRLRAAAKGAAPHHAHAHAQPWADRDGQQSEVARQDRCPPPVRLTRDAVAVRLG